jgi:DNA integrity scanning protein DisA with diadenylate cyclase activity
MIDHQERHQRNIARNCGISEEKAHLLVEAGFVRLSDIREATDDELWAIPGIGVSLVRKIRKNLR